MPDKIKCPNCGELVEVTEALRHEVEDKIRKQSEVVAEAKAKEKFELQAKLSADELAAAKEQNKQLITQLSEMNKTLVELRRKDEEREMRMQKKLAEDAEKIRQEARKQAEESQYLKILEKEKQLQDALKVNEELSRKLQQGSQQTQGEVLELDLEQMLAQEFPHDKIAPVGKGVRGADVIQEVWDRNGNNCGRIVWESKNAKWSDGWILKLKEDQRQAKGEVAILVTENMPEGSSGAVFKDGVWVVQRSKSSVLPLAYALRFGVIQVQFERRKGENKSEKAEILYNYITGTTFRQRMEAIAEAFAATQDELEKERRWFATKWSRQEKALRKVMDHIYGMKGDLQGIDQTALGNLKILELPEGEEAT